MSQLSPFTVSHIVDTYKRYPGESVQLQTRVTLSEAMNEFTLTVTIPPALIILRNQATRDGRSGMLASDGEMRSIQWSETKELKAGLCLDYMVEAKIDPDQLVWQTQHYSNASDAYRYAESTTSSVTHDQLILESSASVHYGGSNSGSSLPPLTREQRFQEETTQFAVIAKGNYLQYLPALYEQDDFMGRFLMLFESFWGPLETQVAQIHHNFNPALTPSAMLPWLASWYDLELGAGWSERQKRLVLEKVMRLYRRRGAQQGLQEYLEQFSGGTVKITEYASGSFRIGRDAQLGSGIALGSSNAPHTFAVEITTPQINEKCEAPIDDAVRKNRIALLTECVKAIIDAEKPAHTVCTALTIE